MKSFLFWGCVMAALAVALGAFGAHGLKNMVTTDRLAVFETAVRYHMYHAFALIAFGLWQQFSHTSANMVGYGFLAGILIFSGSLYALVLLDKGILGAITPIGGVFLIASWLLWAYQIYKQN